MSIPSQDFERIWAAATQECPPQPMGAAGQLVQSIADLLDVDQVEHSSIDPAAFFLVDFSSLGFIGMDLNLLAVLHIPTDDSVAEVQYRLLADFSHMVNITGFCFFIYLTDHPLPHRPEVPPSLRPIFLTRSDLVDLFASRLPQAVLFQIIRRQVPLERMCPFDTTTEAHTDTFRGRRRELDRLVHDLNTSFLISGGRRIGKTSLLKRAYHILRTHRHYRSSQDQRERVFYLNCLTWGDWRDCCIRLAHVIDPRSETRIETGTRNVSYMLQRRSHSAQRPLLLFFDELDAVVDQDGNIGWKFLSVLAEAVSMGWIRVVFAGYRSVARLNTEYRTHPNHQADQTQSNPFQGKLASLFLEPLSRVETHSLLSEPFRSLDIPLREEHSLLERIWQTTNGNPWIVQFYGERLFRLACERSSPEILLQDLDQVESGFELHDLLLAHFLDNTLENGKPMHIERLCAYLLSTNESDSYWAEGDFLTACRRVIQNVVFDDVHSALRTLTQTGILGYTRGHYSFTLPVVKQAIKSTFPEIKAILPVAPEPSATVVVEQTKAPRVFLVHGRNETVRERVARFLENVGIAPVILCEQPNEGRTIIEKVIDYSDVPFAVVLLTADDVGRLASAADDMTRPRVRQNVLFELGYFIGKLGRKSVCALYEPTVEIPSDYNGVLFLELDNQGAWQLSLARELDAAGFEVDMKKVLRR